MTRIRTGNFFNTLYFWINCVFKEEISDNRFYIIILSKDSGLCSFKEEIPDTRFYIIGLNNNSE